MNTKYKVGDRVVFFQKKTTTLKPYQVIIGTINLIKLDSQGFRYDSENFRDVEEDCLCSLAKAPSRFKTFLKE